MDNGEEGPGEGMGVAKKYVRQSLSNRSFWSGVTEANRHTVYPPVWDPTRIGNLLFILLPVQF